MLIAAAPTRPPQREVLPDIGKLPLDFQSFTSELQRVLEYFQQPLQFRRVLCECALMGDDSPQIRNMTFYFVDAALSLLQPTFGPIPFHVKGPLGSSSLIGERPYPAAALFGSCTKGL